MDHRLVGWARAVKARSRHRLPPLWLFTDPARMHSLERAVAALPPGLCGVVFRHDGAADRSALLRRIARLCRAHRIALVVAGAGPVPAGAGRHLRGGRLVPHKASCRTCNSCRPSLSYCTSSAHGPAEIVRARRAGATAIFLSPAYPTASHPGAAGLGSLRWAGMARRAQAASIPIFALGGIDGVSVRRLPKWTAGAGAIDALAP